MPHPKRSIAGLIGLAAVVTFAALSPPSANGQQGAGPGTPVLVVIDDEDSNAVIRSSPIARKFLDDLAGAMPRHGLRMIDAESVARDLDWRISDRIPRPDLLDALENMHKSQRAEHFHRAWVLLQVRIVAQQSLHGVRATVNVDGQIFIASSGQFVDAIEPSREQFPVPAGCLASPACANDFLGDRTREIAPGVAALLARKLERYFPPGSSGSGGGAAVTGGATGTGGSTHVGAGHGMMTPYTVTLRYFEDPEALTIIGVMTDEFPGYESVELMKKSSTVRRYYYLTTAKATKLEEWLYILLRDMGFDAKREFMVHVQGTEIIVDKLVPIPTPDRPASPDERR